MQPMYSGILTKTLLIICTLVCVLTLSFVALSFNMVTAKFEQLETGEATIDLERVAREVHNLQDVLASKVADWAPWDDTYAFVEQPDQTYEDKNLSKESFQTLGLDFMLFFDNNNHLVYSRFFDPERQQFTTPDASLILALNSLPEVFHFSSNKEKKTGLLLSGSTPFLIAAAPIVTSEFTGPIHGTLIFGISLNQNRVDQIGRQTRLSVELVPYDIHYQELFASPKSEPFIIDSVPHPVAHQVENNQILRGYTLINDLQGKPAMIFAVTKDRKLYHQGLAMWQQHALSTCVLGVLFLLSLVVLLNRTILRRLTGLTGEVVRIAENGSHQCRVRVQGRDEIGELAIRINGMLASLQQLQAQKQQNEEHLQKIFDSINCGIMIVAVADRRILSINKAGANLAGRSPEEIVGQLCHRFICPRERDNCPVLDKGQTVDLDEYALLHADGREIPVLKSVSRIDQQGQDLLVESFIDISELKQAQTSLAASEAKYRHFFEDDLTGNFITTHAGLIIDCNPALAKILGYESPAEIIGGQMQQYYYAPETRWQLLERLQEKGKLERTEGVLRHRNGQPVYILSNLIGEFDDQGRLEHIRGYIFDDTKRVLLEKEIRQAQKLEAIGTMAGGIAHDFNNILAGIMGYAEIILRDLDEQQAPKSCNNLRNILSAGERARGLIERILTFSRQTEGKPQPVDLALALEDVLQLIRVSLPTTITIEQHIHDPGTVLADPIQIHQLFMNLCTNAGHAMKNGGGTLTITLDKRHLDADFTANHPELPIGDYTRIQIADTGKGIAEHLIDRIFDPFFTTKPKGEGTGLGLSMVHGIVTTMNGLITVDSQEGHGTCFTIYLHSIKEEATMLPIEYQSIPTGHEHVVYVDDEGFLVDIGSEILRGLGYQVTGFTDSREALDFLLHHASEVALVISDMTMPKLTGVELAQALQQLPSPPPVIICTGHNEGFTGDDFAPLGIHELLLKPISVNKLAQVVRTVLDQHQQR